jgi:CubicO group peptidase (beta-lactamase class C family)
MHSSFQLRKPPNAWNRDIDSRMNLLSNTCVAIHRPELCGSITEILSEGIAWSSAPPVEGVRICDEPMDTEYGFAYGYGIEVHRRDGFAHLGHTGGMPGYEAFMLIDTDHGLGVALVSTRPSIIGMSNHQLVVARKATQRGVGRWACVVAPFSEREVYQRLRETRRASSYNLQRRASSWTAGKERSSKCSRQEPGAPIWTAYS